MSSCPVHNLFNEVISVAADQPADECGEIVIKRKRKRWTAIDPCLGYYVSPSSNIPHAEVDGRIYPLTHAPPDRLLEEIDTHLPSIPGAGVAICTSVNIPATPVALLQPPIAYLEPEGSDSDDRSPLTVHEFLQRSSGRRLKRYGRRYRLATVNLDDGAPIFPSQEVFPLYTPGPRNGASWPSTPRSQSTSSIPVPPPPKKVRKILKKSLEQRLLEAAVYSGAPAPLTSEGGRRPLAFHPVSNTFSAARTQKRKWKFVEPAKRSSIMNTAAFGSVDTHAIAAVSHDLASACYQPMTTWNLHGLSPSTTSDDQPAAQKRRARRSSYCNTNFGPLSFVPLAEHEDGLRHKYHSATSPLPAPKLESNAPLDDVHPLRFEALSAKTHRRCSAVSRLATRKSSTGVLQPGALSNNAFQALTQDHPPGLRPGGGYELSDEAGNNPSDARPPATAGESSTLHLNASLTTVSLSASYAPGLDTFAKATHPSSAKPLMSLTSFMDDFLETAREATRERHARLGLHDGIDTENIGSQL